MMMYFSFGFGLITAIVTMLVLHETDNMNFHPLQKLKIQLRDNSPNMIYNNPRLCRGRTSCWGH